MGLILRASDELIVAIVLHEHEDGILTVIKEAPWEGLLVANDAYGVLLLVGLVVLVATDPVNEVLSLCTVNVDLFHRSCLYISMKDFKGFLLSVGSALQTLVVLHIFIKVDILITIDFCQVFLEETL